MTAPTTYDVEAFLGREVDPVQSQAHLETVTAFARAYTRGRGFTDGIPADDIATVIVTATARLLSNPVGTVTEQVGSYSVRYGTFAGFNLVEMAVLNTYRKRAL